MPIAISEEQLALQASIREWSRQAGTLGLVRRLEPVSSPGGDQGGLHQPDPDVGGGRTGARPAQGGDALSGLHPR